MITKILFHGAQQIGKTNLVRRLAGENFEEKYVQTIGVEIKNLRPIQFQIWDTSGDERFRVLRNNYYKGSEIVCLCFDPKNKASFRMTKEEIDSIKKSAILECQFILVETCSDLQNSPEVSEEKIEKFKNKQGISYHVKTSAKNENDPGVKELTDIFNKIYLDKLKQQESQKKQEAETESLLNDSKSENNYSFLLKAVIATAAAGGIGLCVAAILTAGIVGSIPLAASLLAGGVVLTAAAAVGTFFYHRSNQSKEEGQSIENNNYEPLGI